MPPYLDDDRKSFTFSLEIILGLGDSCKNLVDRLGCILMALGLFLEKHYFCRGHAGPIEFWLLINFTPGPASEGFCWVLLWCFCVWEDLRNGDGLLLVLWGSLQLNLISYNLSHGDKKTLLYLSSVVVRRYCTKFQIVELAILDTGYMTCLKFVKIYLACMSRHKLTI